MKRALLYFSVSIPVTYDETKMSETQALDATQRAAEAAINRAVEGRHLAPDGSYQDYHGPVLAASVPPTAAPQEAGDVARCDQSGVPRSQCGCGAIGCAAWPDLGPPPKADPDAGTGNAR